MPEEVTIDRNLFFVRESGSGAAILVMQGHKQVWIPRSQISYMRKDAESYGSIPLIIRIPAWLAEEKNLHE